MIQPTDASLTFVSYISGLVLAASVYIGDEPDPMTGLRAVNLTSAGHAIDVLAMLEEKTRGNLTDDERRLLEGALYELKMKYVEASSKGPSRIVSP
jgi:Domain of unknown function (DUF1844)